MNAADRPISILVCALGGEGGGVLAEWLVETATRCGHSVQSTSIPGVAQRTGATTYYIEVFPRPDAELGGRRPVFSLSPVPGALDLLVSSELLETVRQIGNGMATAARTQVISSHGRTLTTAEKMQLGDGRASSDDLLRSVRRHSREAQVFDMTAAAAEAGTVISAVLYGAIAASGALPFARAAFEQSIGTAGKSADASRRGFAKAYEIVSALRAERAAVQAAVQTTLAGLAPDAGLAVTLAPASLVSAPLAPAPLTPAPLAPALRDFPPQTHEIVGLGRARMLDYQDAAYAELYLQRLQRVLAAERASDPDGAHGYETTRASARYLALWMAFDDIVRVADLKCRASRLARVRREVKAGDADLLRIYDHFKPGIPEFAGLLPQRLADTLTRWDRRRVARGRPPFGLPLKLGTHTISGFLALRLLAGMKGLRRRGSRYAAEQTMIERWLAGIERGAREDWQLGHALAECGRLIKGYGTTNERGKQNLLHVLDHLATAAAFDSPAQRAEAIDAARNAALADDAGTALDRALAQLGAPATPVREQPILWVRKRPGTPHDKSRTTT
ncbi:MAG: indolepyruvate oxidoreductase subunit beta family protein [Caldimonas sp.]